MADKPCRFKILIKDCSHSSPYHVIAIEKLKPMNRATCFLSVLMLLSLNLKLSGGNVIADSTLKSGRTIDAIVTTQWLHDHLEDSNLVILDLRDPKLFATGHIKGSVNITAPGNFFECFMDPDCGLWMELPSDVALFKTIGNAGITVESTVVLFGGTNITHSLEAGYYGLTLSARVAITLLYAGIENVAILDGGYTKWVAEGRSISTENAVRGSSPYKGETNRTIFVQKKYIEDRLGKSILVDTREANAYFGLEKGFLSTSEGHIPTSKLLSAPWIWTRSGDQPEEVKWLSWKDASKIDEIASAILGEDKEKEIIVYCGAGGYASPVYYILSEQLNYKNVKFYDGSMQEWTADPDAPVVKYKYE